MPDWSKADKELVKEALHSGERYLQGQLVLATSADQRSAVLAGIFTAAGTAIFAGLIAASAGGNAVPWGIAAGGFVAGGLFLAAAAFCVLAVLPIGFWLSGNEPENWYKDITQQRPAVEVFGDEAANYQEKIIDNRAALQRNARRYKTGALMGVGAPLAGMIVWFFFQLCACLTS